MGDKTAEEARVLLDNLARTLRPVEKVRAREVSAVDSWSDESESRGDSILGTDDEKENRPFNMMNFQLGSGSNSRPRERRRRLQPLAPTQVAEPCESGTMSVEDMIKTLAGSVMTVQQDAKGFQRETKSNIN